MIFEILSEGAENARTGKEICRLLNITARDLTAADAERMQDGKPVVIFRQNRRQWMIALSLADFLELKGGATDGKDEH